MKLKSVLLVLWVLVSATVAGQTPSGTEPAKSFERVDRIGEANARSFFVFATAERNYAIRHDGHGESYAVKVMRRNFDLKMGPGARLERVYFADEGNDLLLLYEVTDGRSDWAYFLRMDQKLVKLKWLLAVSAMNLGPAVLDGDSAYLTASSFAARIDLNTGKYVWQQNEFDQEKLSEFQSPVLTSDRVVLHEDKEEGRQIELDKTTGAVIKKQ
ncbi:MAG: hypothetical protein C5B55_13125 [Blastocatellia bacterium]|nr:MAG: hypothetical protein C5B55_13125 [Blastocatellia bacterium]